MIHACHADIDQTVCSELLNRPSDVRYILLHLNWASYSLSARRGAVFVQSPPGTKNQQRFYKVFTVVAGGAFYIALVLAVSQASNGARAVFVC